MLHALEDGALGDHEEVDVLSCLGSLGVSASSVFKQVDGGIEAIGWNNLHRHLVEHDDVPVDGCSCGPSACVCSLLEEAVDCGGHVELHVADVYAGIPEHLLSLVDSCDDSGLCDGACLLCACTCGVLGEAVGVNFWDDFVFYELSDCLGK